MGNIFAASEVVEIGIQIEKNGFDFYEALAKQTQKAKAREVFNFLAAQEQKHIAAFEKILSQVKSYQPPESYPGEYFAYLNSLAGESVFTQKDKGWELAKKIKDETEAIESAIKAENDSITFYKGMKKVVPQYGYKTIDEVITQEQGHLKKLTELKSTL